MKTRLFIALGGMAVIALALTFHFTKVGPAKSAPEPARTAAATPDANKLQHALTQQSNKIRRLRKEKSALLSEVGQHVTDLAKPEPSPAPLAGDAAGSPRAAGVGKMMSAVFRQKAEMKLAAMKSRLHLTDEQAEAVRELLGKETDQQAEMASRMFEGKLTQEDMNSATKFDLDGQLKQVLTPEQLTGYQQYKTEEQRQQLQMAAQAELMQLSPALQLTAQQQEQVSAILQQHYQQFVTQQPDSGSAGLDQMLDAKKEALRAVLTPEQQQVYYKFIENERERTKSMMKMMEGAKEFDVPAKAAAVAQLDSLGRITRQEKLMTEIILILAILVLASFASNLMHWRRHASEKFFYHPASGWLRTMFTIWGVAMLLSAVLFLMGLIPSVALPIVGCGFGIATQFYSIWHRHIQRRNTT